MKKKIFIMTGEASGDMHGSMLVNSLKRLEDNLVFFGVGGSRLSDEGVELLYHYSQFSSMGFVEPIMKINFFRIAKNKIESFIMGNRIDTAILIDFPGFNLLLAKRLKKIGVKIIYFISPQIWAWHYSRIKTIKKYVDAVIVLYPFEEKIYQKEGVRSYFVGNPLVDIVSENLYKTESIQLKTKSPCIGLMPGSRTSEVKKHLQPMLEAAVLLHHKYRGSFLVPVLEGEVNEIVENELSKPEYRDLDIHLIVDKTYRAIENTDILIVSSGTATLETALIGKPMVIVYKVGIVSEMIARFLIKVDNISLVNIIAEKTICTELLQRDVSGHRIFSEICRLLDNRKLYDEMVKEISIVRQKLGEPGAVERIADKALSLIFEI